eukprot:CFRG1161T1
MEDDGFTLVKSKRKGKVKKNGHTRTHSIAKEENYGGCRHDTENIVFMSDSEKKLATTRLKSMMIMACTAVEATDFLSESQILISEALLRMKSSAKTTTCTTGYKEAKVTELVCYGVGSLSESLSARYQMAVALALRSHLGLPSNALRVYEPILSEYERTLLQTEYGCEIIEQNEEGKRTISDTTIFFMPHCSARLYNNLLWANWGAHLWSQLIVIGNSFERYHLCHPKKKLEKEVPCLKIIIDYTEEVPLPPFQPLKSAFNDTMIITFRSSLDAPLETFATRPEPPPPLSLNYEL